MPARIPDSPNTTDRTSWSSPTHIITKSAPSAAAAGVDADLPPCSSIHASALAVVRL
jgi:hypothetical protein